MRRRSIYGLFLALSAVGSAAWAAPRIETAWGPVRGTSAAGVEAFLGLPYAAAPTGERRWRAPEPLTSWSGERDATRYGPACAQGIAGSWGPYSAEFIAQPPVSEDCLTLNLWKPAGRADRLPVLVFIHGGAFQGGAGSLPIYNGSELAARGALVITINYRVGVFGFLAHPALTAESPQRTSGNYGLLDQLAALKWVRANVARFGGDPDKVTVAGESAGAASVNSLIVSPLARGLFRRAVSFSGASMAMAAPSLAKGEQVGTALAARLGVGSVAELRAVPADRLIAVTTAPPPGGGRPPIVHVPHVDGVALPHSPDDAAAPIASKVPLLTGFNAAEMIDMAVRTPAQFVQAVNARYGDFAARLLALYPHATEDEVARSRVLLARDRYMAGLLIWSERRTLATGQPVYAYLYDHAYPPARGQAAYGAFHSSQLPYVFGALGHGDRNFGPADRAVSRQWQDRLLAFMRTGNPSVKGMPWPRMAKGATRVMGLGDKAGMRPAVSTPERLEAFRAYAASGGNLGLN